MTAALDRAVANAMGLKSVNNCEKWGKQMNELNEFGKAPIKMEGGIANPDEFAWECACNDCQVKYQKWKEAFDAQQNQLKEKTE